MIKLKISKITDNRIFWLVYYENYDIYQHVYEYAGRKTIH